MCEVRWNQKVAAVYGSGGKVTAAAPCIGTLKFTSLLLTLHVLDINVHNGFLGLLCNS